MDPRTPGFWQRHFRKILWGIALAVLLISILITLFTPVTFLFIFLPFIFTPVLWPRRPQRGDLPEDEDENGHYR